LEVVRSGVWDDEWFVEVSDEAGLRVFDRLMREEERVRELDCIGMMGLI